MRWVCEKSRLSQSTRESTRGIRYKRGCNLPLSVFGTHPMRSNRFSAYALLPAVLLAFAISGMASDGTWPQFRGPDGQGHSLAEGLPVMWSESENVAWKTAIPGEGHSSPVIADGQIWLTTAEIEPLADEALQQRLAAIPNSRGLQIAGRMTLKVLQLDAATGKIVRDIPVFTVDDVQPKHALNSYASPTSVIHEGRLVVHFGSYGSAAVDCDSGAVIWKNEELKVDHQNGPGSSPIVAGNLMIVHMDGIDEQYIAALDVVSGEVAWKTKRTGKMNERPEMQKAYGTPLIVEADGRQELISPAADWVYAYDPETGEELWKAHYGKLGFSTVPRPVAGNGLVYICTSFMQSRLLAVKPGGTGDVTETHIVWTADRQIPKKPSLMLSGSELYAVSDGGILTALNATTGEELWQERLPGEYSASPLYAGGRIYFFSQDGVATVIEQSGEYREVARNRLDEGFMASPAVADGSLFLRTTGHLYRIADEQTGG